MHIPISSNFAKIAENYVSSAKVRKKKPKTVPVPKTPQPPDNVAPARKLSLEERLEKYACDVAERETRAATARIQELLTFDKQARFRSSHVARPAPFTVQKLAADLYRRSR